MPGWPMPTCSLRSSQCRSAAGWATITGGPSLGGFLTEAYGWRSMFYVNLPIGLVSLLFVWRFLPHLRSRKSSGPIRIDWTGAGLIAVGLGALQLAVETFAHAGWSRAAVLLSLAAVLALAVLWWWEARCSHPIIPIDMFSNPKVGPLFVLAVLGGFMMFSLLVYLPLLFQGAFGMGPRDAGMIITPLVLGIAVGSVINGRIVTRLRAPRRMLFVGFALLGAGSLGVSFATVETSRAMLLLMMSVGGLGLGFINPNLVIFTQVMAGREALGIATAMQHSLRMVGGMAGAAQVGSLVRYHYTAQVGAAFADPQILVDEQLQRTLLERLQANGQDGAVLLAQAREALAGSIQLGLLLVVLVGVVALWRVGKVPHISFTLPAG